MPPEPEKSKKPFAPGGGRGGVFTFGISEPMIDGFNVGGHSLTGGDTGDGSDPENNGSHGAVRSPDNADQPSAPAPDVEMPAPAQPPMAVPPVQGSQCQFLRGAL